MGKIVAERKFRKYKRSGTSYCDKCGKEIERWKWHFSRRIYEILRKEASTSFGATPPTRTIEETILCEDCGKDVPKIGEC